MGTYRGGGGAEVHMVVDHSRNTLAKQWSDIREQLLQGVGRLVAAHVSHIRVYSWFPAFWVWLLGSLEQAVSATPSRLWQEAAWLTPFNVGTKAGSKEAVRGAPTSLLPLLLLVASSMHPNMEESPSTAHAPVQGSEHAVPVHEREGIALDEDSQRLAEEFSVDDLRFALYQRGPSGGAARPSWPAMQVVASRILVHPLSTEYRSTRTTAVGVVQELGLVVVLPCGVGKGKEVKYGVGMKVVNGALVMQHDDVSKEGLKSPSPTEAEEEADPAMQQLHALRIPLYPQAAAVDSDDEELEEATAHQERAIEGEWAVPSFTRVKGPWSFSRRSPTPRVKLWESLAKALEAITDAAILSHDPDEKVGVALLECFQTFTQLKWSPKESPMLPKECPPLPHLVQVAAAGVLDKEAMQQRWEASWERLRQKRAQRSIVETRRFELLLRLALRAVEQRKFYRWRQANAEAADSDVGSGPESPLDSRGSSRSKNKRPWWQVNSPRLHILSNIERVFIRVLNKMLEALEGATANLRHERTEGKENAVDIGEVAWEPLNYSWEQLLKVVVRCACCDESPILHDALRIRRLGGGLDLPLTNGSPRDDKGQEDPLPDLPLAVMTPMSGFTVQSLKLLRTMYLSPETRKIPGAALTNVFHSSLLALTAALESLRARSSALGTLLRAICPLGTVSGQVVVTDRTGILDAPPLELKRLQHEVYRHVQSCLHIEGSPGVESAGGDDAEEAKVAAQGEEATILAFPSTMWTIGGCVVAKGGGYFHVLPSTVVGSKGKGVELDVTDADLKRVKKLYEEMTTSLHSVVQVLVVVVYNSMHNSGTQSSKLTGLSGFESLWESLASMLGHIVGMDIQPPAEGELDASPGVEFVRGIEEALGLSNLPYAHTQTMSPPIKRINDASLHDPLVFLYHTRQQLTDLVRAYRQESLSIGWWLSKGIGNSGPSEEDLLQEISASVVAFLPATFPSGRSAASESEEGKKDTLSPSSSSSSNDHDPVPGGRILLSSFLSPLASLTPTSYSLLLETTALQTSLLRLGWPVAAVELVSGRSGLEKGAEATSDSLGALDTPQRVSDHAMLAMPFHSLAVCLQTELRLLDAVMSQLRGTALHQSDNSAPIPAFVLRFIVRVLTIGSAALPHLLLLHTKSGTPSAAAGAASSSGGVSEGQLVARRIFARACIGHLMVVASTSNSSGAALKHMCGIVGIRRCTEGVARFVAMEKVWLANLSPQSYAKCPAVGEESHGDASERFQGHMEGLLAAAMDAVACLRLLASVMPMGGASITTKAERQRLIRVVTGCVTCSLPLVRMAARDLLERISFGW